MTSKPIRAIVVGGTGYTGAELVRLVLGHPSLELVSIVGNTTAGQVVSDVLPSLKETGDERHGDDQRECVVLKSRKRPRGTRCSPLNN